MYIQGVVLFYRAKIVELAHSSKLSVNHVAEIFKDYHEMTRFKCTYPICRKDSRLELFNVPELMTHYFNQVMHTHPITFMVFWCQKYVAILHTPLIPSLFYHGNCWSKSISTTFHDWNQLQNVNHYFIYSIPLPAQ